MFLYILSLDILDCSGGTGSTAIILSSDGQIVGRSSGQGTNHWVWSENFSF